MDWPKRRLASLKHPPVSQLLSWSFHVCCWCSCWHAGYTRDLLLPELEIHLFAPLECSTACTYYPHCQLWGGVQEGLLFLLPTLAPLSSNCTYSPLGEVLSLTAHGLRGLSHPYKDTSQVTLTIIRYVRLLRGWWRKECLQRSIRYLSFQHALPLMRLASSEHPVRSFSSNHLATHIF